jgi:uncharacterized RDD family membrane protein YckC
MATLSLAPLRVAARLPLVGIGARRRAVLAERGRAAQAAAAEFASAAALDLLESPEMQRSIDRALRGPLVDSVAHSMAEHQTIERAASPVVTTPEFERLVLEAVESKVTAEVTLRMVESPEIRRALTRQTATVFGTLLDRIVAAAARVDDALAGLVRRPFQLAPPVRPSPFGGISLRGLALGIDLALVESVVLVTVALLALINSLAGGLGAAWVLGTVIASSVAVVAGAYLTFFWTVAGQTPGMSLMRLRVVDARGERPGLGRSLVRLFGLWLAIVPLFGGVLPILFDSRRRGVQDFLARTTVERITRGD